MLALPGRPRRLLPGEQPAQAVAVVERLGGRRAVVIYRGKPGVGKTLYLHASS
jgi:hypothetical protein